MANITTYLQKRQQLEKLNQEIEKLEQDETIQSELKLIDELKSLMEQYSVSAAHILNVLQTIDPSLGSTSAKGSGTGDRHSKRPMQEYRNPHTGEVVRTRGANHKTLKEWREHYGKDTVLSWKVT